MTTPAFLVRLLASSGFYGRKGAEDAEAIRFCAELRVAAIEQRLRCIFVHPPLELMRKDPRSALAAALGAIEGAPDYFFAARDGSMVIEFKTKNGRQTPAQRDFQAWAEHFGVEYRIARTAEQGWTMLRDRGWLC